MQNSIARNPIAEEFLREQLPLIALCFAAGIAASYWQHGALVGVAGVEFPLAGVYVPLWHLVWMGFWTGYTMALVGEASGIFSLPYSMSILRFDNIFISPTNTVLTFLNPLGAILGFRSEKRLNLDLALWPCVGTLFGSQIGPFIRVFFLEDEGLFKAVTGASLALLGIYMVYQITPMYTRRGGKQQTIERAFHAHAEQLRQRGEMPSGLPEGVELKTLGKSWRAITVEFWDIQWRLSVPLLFALGAGVGLVSSTLGVGGGFLMTPILVTMFGLPLYVIVAITLPYVFVQSAIALFSYTVTVPLITGVHTPPEWAWGLYASAGAIFGAWLASKTQRYVPQRSLKIMAGGVTAITGSLYVVSFFVELPFAV